MNKNLLITLVIFSFCLNGCKMGQVVKDNYSGLKQSVKGHYYLDNKKYKDGILAFNEELQVRPNSAQANYFMGRFQLAENHPKEALSHLKKAAEISPKKADHHFWLGVAYAANHKSDLERKSYLRALELDSKHVQALTYLGHNQLDRSEYKTALKTYNKALALWPKNPSALYNRALILKHLKRTSDEKLAWKAYLDVYNSGIMARQAASNLNALGDFEFRNHLIGTRMITLEKIKFNPFTAELTYKSQPSIKLLSQILIDNLRVDLHIVAYQKNDIELAEARAKSIKRYILNHFSHIHQRRIKASWFDISEKIKIGRTTFREDESINFFSVVESKKIAKAP